MVDSFECVKMHGPTNPKSNKDIRPRAFGELLLTDGLLETARSPRDLNTTAAGSQFEKLQSTEKRPV